ncbi:hypothetical protein [Chryseobacterium jejuense]|uniref:hypothetical protein n=1 Tax=Chryseobacterium jejuense TaxID=445960 RepID=UPI001AEB3B63|nr:hypothetical protein [Chryseobacterium jejuense]MBP2618051.1 hypothetical protein [Chryseobacterium jejuense]
MKKIVLFSIFCFLSSNLSFAQIATNQQTVATITDENAFLDASSNFDESANSSNTIGKGLVYPRTNLTTWVFKTDNVDGINFPTGFDGMIVYNTGTGNTLTGANNPSTVSTVAPGFYYFSNPIAAGSATGSAAVTTGRWLPLGGAVSPKVTIGTAETTTNTLVNVSPGVDKQVYAIKGSFVASGTSTAVNIPAPSGMTTMYAITIYKSGSGVVYDRSLYSYNVVTTAGNAITGSPSMSVVYPNGTYDYVLEYLK